MENPIAALRQELDLSRAQLAARAGTCYARVAQAELGHYEHLPRKLVTGLRIMGIDAEALEAAYSRWRTEVLAA